MFSEIKMRYISKLKHLKELKYHDLNFIKQIIFQKFQGYRTAFKIFK